MRPRCSAVTVGLQLPPLTRVMPSSPRACCPLKPRKPWLCSFTPRFLVHISFDFREGSYEKGLDRVEDDLVYFSKNFQIILKGGTIEKVIERLTADTQADNSVVDTFLLTYRKFISPENLLERLFERYNLKPPRPLAEMDPHAISMHEHSVKVIRLRFAPLPSLPASHK